MRSWGTEAAAGSVFSSLHQNPFITSGRFFTSNTSPHGKLGAEISMEKMSRASTEDDLKREGLKKTPLARSCLTGHNSRFFTFCPQRLKVRKNTSFQVKEVLWGAFFLVPTPPVVPPEAGPQQLSIQFKIQTKGNQQCLLISLDRGPSGVAHGVRCLRERKMRGAQGQRGCGER